jgi:hypothetical protein
LEIYKKLLAIQSELKAPKSQYNNFGKYKYRNCEDILESLKPLLTKNEAVVTISDEIITVGQRFYLKATAKIFDTQTGESIETTAYAREEETKKGMDGGQLTGCSSSYARKYALNGLFSIDDTKDSDFSNGGEKGNTDINLKNKLKELISEYSKKSDKKINRVVEEIKQRAGKDLSLFGSAELKNTIAYLETKVNKKI